MTPRSAVRCALFSSLTIFLAVASAVRVNAQEQAGEPATKVPSAAEANNPLAKFQAFNVHNYYVPALSELDGQNANTFWLRYAQPFGKWLFRASLPASRVPMGDSKTMSGLGDFNAFAAYLFDTGDPAVSFGVGPQFTVPTASEDETGTGKWQGGLAATFFNAKSPTLQWGGLVTWQTDFAGDDGRSGNERPRGPALLFRPARWRAVCEGVGGGGVRSGKRFLPRTGGAGHRQGRPDERRGLQYLRGAAVHDPRSRRRAAGAADLRRVQHAVCEEVAIRCRR